MRRIPTMMASAGAAALTTLAVTVAGPAIGDDGGTYPSNSPETFAACLTAHGLAGVPDGDGAALKEWLRGRLDAGDATAKRAVEACAPPKPVPVPEADRAAEEAKLRSCLAAHGADVPDAGGGDLKRWVITHHTEAATAAALRACHLQVGEDDGHATADCAKPDGPAGEGVGGKPADPPDASAAKIVRHPLRTPAT
ncbi:MAG TPA: hypothetical protein VNT55_24835 [Baekduia sp.]|nr:hypothetical protein [Baekduia sp.]